MRKTLTLLFASMLATQAWAADFEYNGLYYEIIDDNSVSVVHDDSYTSFTSVSIPDKAIDGEDEYYVTSIGDDAFESCFSLESITIPKAVTSIGSKAFGNCYALESITIPEAVTSIGNSAFESCSSLSSITIPKNVSSIGVSAFSRCGNLSAVYVEDGNTSYKSVEGVLYDYDGKTILFCPQTKTGSFNVPNGVVNIAPSAFAECEELTSVTLPLSVTSIGNDAFTCCKKLSSINIPDDVISIGQSAFYYCENLKSIDFFKNITSIGYGAFMNCNSLTSVYIPKNIDTIEENAFYDCSNIEIYCEASAKPEKWQNNWMGNVPDERIHWNAVPTNITETNTASVTIYPSGRNIIVENAVGKEITVSDLTGRVIISQQVETDKVCLAIQSRGMYIVKVGKTQQKVLIN